MVVTQEVYAARLNIDYPETLDRVTTAFRMLWIIPIAIVLSVLSAQAMSTVTIVKTTGQVVAQLNRTNAGIGGALSAATLLMILFRQRYPRWWFDFALQLSRFVARVGAYAALLTDRYPSTEDEQSVHLDIDCPPPGLGVPRHDQARALPRSRRPPTHPVVVPRSPAVSSGLSAGSGYANGSIGAARTEDLRPYLDAPIPRTLSTGPLRSP